MFNGLKKFYDTIKDGHFKKMWVHGSSRGEGIHNGFNLWETTRLNGIYLFPHRQMHFSYHTPGAAAAIGFNGVDIGIN